MKIIIFFYSLLIGLSALAQADSMYVSGRYLYNLCGDTVTLRGINYPVLDDWNFPANMNNGTERLSEIEKTGANCVRIQWYNNYGQPARSAFALKDLDSLLTRCARYKLIPIIGLWDLTTTNNWAAFPQIITAWWTQPEVVQLIKKHQQYLIMDIANEMGHCRWTANPQAAAIQFETNYKTAIVALRNAGIHIPVMIDAPDGGQSMDVIRQVGYSLINSDPLKNIVFGVHTYWWAYPKLNATIADFQNEFQLTKNANLPIVIGEVASYQSESGEQCNYDLSLVYPEILKIAKQFETGWIAWCWNKDNCTLRQLSSTGLFANLTAWGNDFINNPEYGIKGSSRKISSFEKCVCFAYRTWYKRCTGVNRRKYMKCVTYKNSKNGTICETKCESCKTYFHRRGL